ncbi:hypothetical protein ACPV5Q_21245, partial [Vibrio astriarenae]
ISIVSHRPPPLAAGGGRVLPSESVPVFPFPKFLAGCGISALAIAAFGAVASPAHAQSSDAEPAAETSTPSAEDIIV